SAFDQRTPPATAISPMVPSVTRLRTMSPVQPTAAASTNAGEAIAYAFAPTHGDPSKATSAQPHAALETYSRNAQARSRNARTAPTSAAAATVVTRIRVGVTSVGDKRKSPVGHTPKTWSLFKGWTRLPSTESRRSTDAEPKKERASIKLGKDSSPTVAARTAMCAAVVRRRTTSQITAGAGTRS